MRSTLLHFAIILFLHIMEFFTFSSERTCETNPLVENSSFIFTVCIKSAPLYHVKLAYVVLHMAVKEFFETNF